VSRFSHFTEPLFNSGSDGNKNSVQYAAVKAILYLFNDGKGFPTIESFKKDPQTFINFAIETAKKEGVPLE
jgi:hypothetical protein